MELLSIPSLCLALLKQPRTQWLLWPWCLLFSQVPQLSFGPTQALPQNCPKCNHKQLMRMSELVVRLDVHLKRTQVTVMKNDLIGGIVKKERVDTSRAELRKSLEFVPKGTRLASESVGFCWPWIDFLKGDTFPSTVYLTIFI